MAFPFNVPGVNLRFIALLWAIVGLIAGGIGGYNALSNEITGTAIYHRSTSARGSTSEAVTREQSPTKFREATNVIWIMSGFSFVVGVIGVILYRKLADC